MSLAEKIRSHLERQQRRLDELVAEPLSSDDSSLDRSACRGRGRLAAGARSPPRARSARPAGRALAAARVAETPWDDGEEYDEEEAQLIRDFRRSRARAAAAAAARPRHDEFDAYDAYEPGEGRRAHAATLRGDASLAETMQTAMQYRSQLARLEARIVERDRDHEDVVRALKDERAALRVRADEYAETAADLRVRLEQAEAALAGAREEAGDAVAEAGAMRSRAERAETASTAAKSLERQVDELTRERDVLESRLEGKAEAYAALLAKSEELQQSRDHAVSDLAASRRRSDELERDVRTLREQMATEAEAARQKTLRLEETVRERDDMQRELDRLHGEAGRRTGELESCREALATSQSKAAALESRVAELTRQARDQGQRLDAGARLAEQLQLQLERATGAKVEAEQAAGDAERLRETNARLSAELEAARRDGDAAATEAQRVKQALAAARQQLDVERAAGGETKSVLRRVSHDLAGELRALERHLDAARTGMLPAAVAGASAPSFDSSDVGAQLPLLEDVQAVLVGLRERVRESAAVIVRTEAALAEARSDAEHGRASLATAEANAAEAHRQLADVRQRLEQERAGLSAANDERARLHEAVGAAEAELAELRAAVDERTAFVRAICETAESAVRRVADASSFAAAGATAHNFSAMSLTMVGGGGGSATPHVPPRRVSFGGSALDETRGALAGEMSWPSLRFFCEETLAQLAERADDAVERCGAARAAEDEARSRADDVADALQRAEHRAQQEMERMERQVNEHVETQRSEAEAMVREATQAARTAIQSAEHEAALLRDRHEAAARELTSVRATVDALTAQLDDATRARRALATAVQTLMCVVKPLMRQCSELRVQKAVLKRQQTAADALIAEVAGLESAITGRLLERRDRAADGRTALALTAGSGASANGRHGRPVRRRVAPATRLRAVAILVLATIRLRRAYGHGARAHEYLGSIVHERLRAVATPTLAAVNEASDAFVKRLPAEGGVWATLRVLFDVLDEASGGWAAVASAGTGQSEAESLADVFGRRRPIAVGASSSAAGDLASAESLAVIRRQALDLIRRMTEAEERANGVQSELDLVMVERDDLQRQVVDLETSVGELEHEVREMRMAAKRNVDVFMYDALRADHEQLTVAHDRLLAEQEENGAQLQRTRRVIGELREGMDVLEARLAEREDACAKAEAELRFQVDEQRRLGTVMREHASDSVRVQDERDAAVAQLGALESQVAELRRERERLSGRVHEADHELDHARRQVTRLEMALLDMEKVKQEDELLKGQLKRDLFVAEDDLARVRAAVAVESARPSSLGSRASSAGVAARQFPLHPHHISSLAAGGSASSDGLSRRLSVTSRGSSSGGSALTMESLPAFDF